MRISLTFLFLIGVFTCISAFGAGENNASSTNADFQVYDLKQIDQASWSPFLGPLAWSPNGEKLAYFKRQTMMISDVTGSIQEVYTFEWPPRRFAWVDNENIAVDLQIQYGPDSTLNRLEIVNTLTRITELVESCKYSMRSKPLPGSTTFDGPFISLEGNPYLRITTYQNSKKDRSLGYRWINTVDKGNLQDNHILSRDSTGLNLISIDGSESRQLVPQYLIKRKPFYAISADQKFIINGEEVVSLTDSTKVNLHDFVVDRPKDASLCDFVFVSSNPGYSEMVFQYSCDADNKTISDRVGFYNYLNQELTFIEAPFGAEHCTTPVYSPNGLNVAFIADGYVYILFRRAVQ